MSTGYAGIGSVPITNGDGELSVTVEWSSSDGRLVLAYDGNQIPFDDKGVAISYHLTEHAAAELAKLLLRAVVGDVAGKAMDEVIDNATRPAGKTFVPF